MPIPNVLALDFDGVLCDGMREYFETSRRTYQRVWPDAPKPGDDCFPAFRRLRPVIISGWEMPLLLLAIVRGVPEAEVLRNWPSVRDQLASSGPLGRDALVASLRSTLDEVRREWIASDRAGWVAMNLPYGPLDDLRRLVAEPERTLVVTTKEGAFARLILDEWRVALAGVQGKEAGTHKCDNLRAAITAYEAEHGRRPLLWFVEDALDTLLHVTTHADLDDVGLFLAAWGYNTPETRARVSAGGRVRLLQWNQFSAGLAAWEGPR